MNGTTGPLNQDWATQKCEINLHFQPIPVVDMRGVDQPFRWRLESDDLCVTIKGNYHWGSGSHAGQPLLNEHVLPVRYFTQERLVLYGRRRSFSLADDIAIRNHINEDVFLGAQPTELLYKSRSVNQVWDAKTGALAYDIEKHLIWKPSGWNVFFNEFEGLFTSSYGMYLLLDENNAPAYPSAAFAPLLVAP
jgi:hypothetical protein